MTNRPASLRRNKVEMLSRRRCLVIDPFGIPQGIHIQTVGRRGSPVAEIAGGMNVKGSTRQVWEMQNRMTRWMKTAPKCKAAVRIQWVGMQPELLYIREPVPIC